MFSKGSEWGKWDLHFHTPSSYDYKDRSVTNEKIIEVLKENNISLVAITDHHTIDVERITELRNLAGNDIKILPGIEFCSDSRGREPIHFIGIFSGVDIKSLNYIRDEILSKSGINKQKQKITAMSILINDLKIPKYYGYNYGYAYGYGLSKK